MERSAPGGLRVKKSSKGKEKKLARKAENERAAALAQLVRSLNEQSLAGDLLAAYPAFRRYERKGLAAALRYYAAPSMPAGLLDWALGLTRLHMAALYEACPDWGWSDAKKRAELADPAARYLVVYQQQAQQQQQQQQQQAQPEAATEAASEAAGAAPPAPAPAAIAAPAAAAGEQENMAVAGNGGGSAQQAAGEEGQPVAFVHFRFEEEQGEAVLYCYEIQVAQAVQGCGLGKFLMQLLELVGRRSGVARLMLTVFHQNEAAVALYRKLGYMLDDGSPGALDPSGDHKYEIMTKRLPQQAVKQSAA